MKKIILALAAVLISFSSFSQTVEDIKKSASDIFGVYYSRKFDRVDIKDDVPNFLNAHYSKDDSGIFYLYYRIEKEPFEDIPVTERYHFYYQDGNLIYIELERGWRRFNYDGTFYNRRYYLSIDGGILAISTEKGVKEIFLDEKDTKELEEVDKIIKKGNELLGRYN